MKSKNKNQKINDIDSEKYYYLCTLETTFKKVNSKQNPL